MTPLHWMLIVMISGVATVGAGHALLSKRDPRAALGWIAVCLMFPFVGPFLYYLFGINRIHTRARKLHRRFPPPRLTVDSEAPGDEAGIVISSTGVPPDFAELARTADSVTELPLVSGNLIEVLHNGEHVYPAMLKAIREARHSLFLSTYIFDTDHTGRQFIDALAGAAERGVDVRVMIDGIGELYSLPRAGTVLRKRRVRVVRFLPPKLIPPTLHINLRNHRKILVADGRIGFIGGMNIGDRHLAENTENPSRVVDTHFRLTGPVIAQIEQVFLEDWAFVTREPVSASLVAVGEPGGALCRTVVEGPNEDLEKLVMILVGAVSVARQSIAIMTPYFLPPRELIAGLQAAALRGVEVSIILPAQNNLAYVHWATQNLLGELLQWGVRVYYQPPPFVHTKLFIVDGYYAQIGSANLDPRSLRLNFELAVEVYDRSFVTVLVTHFESVRQGSSELSLRELEHRSLGVKIRDAATWLFSPYL